MSLRRVKATNVTGSAGPQTCETSRLPHYIDNLFTNGCEGATLMHWPEFTSRKIPGTHLCYRLNLPQGYIPTGRIRLIEKLCDLVENQIRDLLTCSTLCSAISRMLGNHVRHGDLQEL
jgi:hypothetical protein